MSFKHGRGGVDTGEVTERAITVALCDDHEIYRRELMTALERDPGIQVVAEAEIPSGLGPVILDHPPKVVVVDMTPSQGTAPEIISTMRDLMPISAVLAVGGPNDELAPALISGANGAVDKSVALDIGPMIIHTLVEGRPFLDQRAARSLLRAIHHHPRRSSLPTRQVDLIDRLAGLPTIADLRAGAFESRQLERELFALLVTLRGVRAGDGLGV